MASAKTKTKVVRILLIESMGKKKETATSLCVKTGLEYSMLYSIINCRRDGTFGVWKKIQEALSLKDSEMWTIINTTKRVNR